MSSLDETPELDHLREVAERARAMNWSPYTSAVVVASVKTTGGEFYGGSNVEVANISLSKHAEETAILAALTNGAMRTADGDVQPRCIEVVYATAAPCGSCRQFILEFATEDCVVHIDDSSSRAGTYRLKELLPNSFGPEQQLAAGGRMEEGRS